MMAAQSITSSSIPNALDEAYSNEALPGSRPGRGGIVNFDSYNRWNLQQGS